MKSSDYGNAIITHLEMKPEGRPTEGGFYVADDFAAMIRGESIGVAAASVRAPNRSWVRVYSAHLTGENAGYDLARLMTSRKQIYDLNQRIFRTEQARDGQPRTILMGDFNISPTNAPAGCRQPLLYYDWQYDNILNWPAASFVDAWKQLHRDPYGGPCGYTQGKPAASRRYDHIFYRKEGNLTLVNTDVIGSVRLSDHHPVVADFIVPR